MVSYHGQGRVDESRTPSALKVKERHIVIIPPVTPAYQLEGITLASGWHIVSRKDPSSNSTGGTFGVGYIAEKDGKRAWVKAMDFVDAITAKDPMQQLAKLTHEANFERDALATCDRHRMSKIVQLIDHETIALRGSTDPLQRVYCIVMEHGEDDLRGRVHAINDLPASWSLGVLRDVSLALDQLHSRGIAHQDVKPSNVLAMSKMESEETNMKLGDLGRVVRKDMAGPWDRLPWPGARHYAPPERWYGFHAPDWTDEREASDAFTLGSVLFFLFTGTTLQLQMVSHIPPPFRRDQWMGGFSDDLIDVLRHAQSKAIANNLLPNLPAKYADRIVDLARQLTDPDPRKRGDRRARRQAGRPVGLDRFHQRFRALALEARVDERMGTI